LSKRTRFEVFRRDGFACQYCGRTPPDVVLHVDHIQPVAAGGGNDETNLVTACADCNLGKADKPADRLPRPDVDLAVLEAQQEISELRAFQAIKAERDSILGDLATALIDTWVAESERGWWPDEPTLKTWIKRYGPELTEEALLVAAGKVRNGLIQGYDAAVRYTGATLRNMERERPSE